MLRVCYSVVITAKEMFFWEYRVLAPHEILALTIEHLYLCLLAVD